MINWILAKLDKYKIKVIRAKFVPDEVSRDWAYKGWQPIEPSKDSE